MIELDLDAILGVVDETGAEALTSDQIEALEKKIVECNEAENNGDQIVPDAIYDRMVEIVKQVDPDSGVLSAIWENGGDDLTDTDAVFRANPMYSIQTIKSYDCEEIKAFVDRLPDGLKFNAHISTKLNGHGIRLIYQYGEYIKARSRARSSAGRDLTEQLRVILERDGLTHISALEGVELCEIRGEWVLPFANMATARTYNDDIKSPFTGVSSMGRDSATKDEWGLLSFVAYEYLTTEPSFFTTKSEEYEYIESLGFEVPMSWTVPDLEKDTLLEEIPGIVSDCEHDVTPDENGENGYAYYTDGIVFAIDDCQLFRQLGDDGGHYKYGNMALKVGYWKQDLYTGYVQTIYWKKGKTKLSPVAIISDNEGDAVFIDDDVHFYVTSEKEIANMNDLGVSTASGNRVRRVPLYEPANLVVLGAYAGMPLHFRYGGEAGVVPCFEDGTPLVEGRIRNAFVGEDDE